MHYRSSVGCHHFFPFVPAGVVFVAGSMAGEWLLVGLLVCASGTLAGMVLSTRYVIKDGVLDARMWRQHRRIRLDEITAIHRWQLEGPVMGLGPWFIGIEYGDGATVNVSPKDIDGFIEAVRAEMRTPGPPVPEGVPA